MGHRKLPEKPQGDLKGDEEKRDRSFYKGGNIEPKAELELGVCMELPVECGWSLEIRNE